MATYSNEEQKASVSISWVTDSIKRDNIFTTSANIDLHFSYRIPTDDLDNSYHARTADSADYQYDSGDWYEYQLIQVTVLAHAVKHGGTSEVYRDTSSSTKYFAKTDTGKFSPLTIGSTETIQGEIRLYYKSIHHHWYTEGTFHDAVTHEEEDTIIRQGITVVTGHHTVVDEPAYWSYTLEKTEETTNYTPSGDAHCQATTSVYTIYTRPGSFSFGCQSGQIIETTAAGGLTAAKVSEWATHAGKYRSWYLQSNQYSSVSGGASKGAVITAAWYNGCVDKITAGGCVGNPTPSKVSGGPNGTIISAAIINALGTAVSKND